MTAIELALALTMTSTVAFQTTLERIQVEQTVPGVSAVISVGDQLVFAGASGVADLETGREMTPDTPLYAGSLSKLFTAVLVLRLVEQGSLSLADPVDGIGAQVTGKATGITVADLLTHASGLEREGDFNYWYSADFPDREALTSYLLRAELREPPGKSLHYSNIGYARLGLIIEAVEGRPYQQVLLSQLLEPLGMASSGVSGPAVGLARGYTPIGRLLPDRQHPFAGVGAAVGDRYLREYHHAQAMTPAFGITVTAVDLSRFTRFLLGHGNHGVLSVAMRKRMAERQPSGWGLGLKLDTFAGRAVARHEGWFAAHRSHVLLDLNAGLTIAVLANSDSAEPAKIVEALYEVLLGEMASHQF